MKAIQRIAVIVAALLLTSCASMTPERLNLLIAIAGQAAQFGAQAWLATHPDHQGAFNAVINALTPLVKAGNTNQNVELLTSLPGNVPGVVTLNGKDGSLYSSDVLVVYDNTTKQSTRITGATVAPVMKATLAGLKLAVAPEPPDPKKARLIVPNAGPHMQFAPGVWVITNASALPATNPHPQGSWKINPSRLQLSNYVHLAESRLEVQEQPGNAMLIIVRWLASNGVYCIEQKAEEEWCQFACVTNQAEGEIAWRLPWPPTCPVGDWRVSRLR